jgi:hypothetical protein
MASCKRPETTPCILVRHDWHFVHGRGLQLPYVRQLSVPVAEHVQRVAAESMLQKEPNVLQSVSFLQRLLAVALKVSGKPVRMEPVLTP